jgi:hypothetical protein
MSRFLKRLKSIALGLVAALVVPSGLLAAPQMFGMGDHASKSVSDGLTRIHCCHSHPYPPYDRYCCHGSGYYAPGRTVARTAVGAAATYGAYRGVRSATKNAYKKGYNKAKKHYKRRR